MSLYLTHTSSLTWPLVLLPENAASHRASADWNVLQGSRSLNKTDIRQVPKQLLPNLMTSSALRRSRGLCVSRDTLSVVARMEFLTVTFSHCNLFQAWRWRSGKALMGAWVYFAFLWHVWHYGFWDDKVGRSCW